MSMSDCERHSLSESHHHHHHRVIVNVLVCKHCQSQYERGAYAFFVQRGCSQHHEGKMQFVLRSKKHILEFSLKVSWSVNYDLILWSNSFFFFSFVFKFTMTAINISQGQYQYVWISAFRQKMYFDSSFCNHKFALQFFNHHHHP